MLKRQDSLLSSSRRQKTQTPPPAPAKDHHAKSVGCMSGIFHLISKYQNRQKLLTFGRKHEKKPVSVPQKSSSVVKEQQQQQREQNNHKIVMSLLDKVQDYDMVTRSPVLSQKIRRSSNVGATNTTTTNNNNPPALLTRLMGLEEEHQPLPCAVVVNNNNKVVHEQRRGGGGQSSSGTTAELKRQRLLQALEKCNEDLEALKKIIVAAQASHKNDLQIQSSMAKEKKEEVVNEPNSPLMKNFNKLHVANGNLQQQVRKMVGKKPGEEDEGIDDISFLNRVLTETSRIKRKATTTPSFWSSKAMIQSVNEVCDDIAWGEKRELGNIGLTLQNQIFKDLIEDFVKEITSHFMYRLPFDACKRRLSFK